MNEQHAKRALIFAPHGRDAALAAGVLAEAGIPALACGDLAELVAELSRGAAFVVLTEETVARVDAAPLKTWLDEQEEWSHQSFILLTRRGGLERNPAAQQHLELLGNVMFLERPFHPTTLASLARTALQGRLRQYETRMRLAALRESDERARLATAAAGIGYWDLDLVNDQLIWTVEVKAMFGISPDRDVSMAEFYAGVHPDDRPATARAVEAACDPTQRTLYDVEFRVIGMEDSVTRWVAAKGRGLFDGSGCCSSATRPGSIMSAPA